MSWAALPEEVTRNIVRYLNREECKRLRLTNKTNSQSVKPTLFKTIHLTPDTRSFGRARALVAIPSIACHVQNVVYHIMILSERYENFGAIGPELVRLNLIYGSKRKVAYDALSTTEDLLAKFRCCLEQLESQRQFAMWDEAKELKEICGPLSMLTSIATIGDEDSLSKLPDDFIGRKTGIHADAHAPGPHFANLLTAVAGRSLTSICAFPISRRELSKVSKDLLTTVDLRNMHRLNIGLSSHLFWCDTHDLDLFLNATMTTNDYTLELGFDDLPYGSARAEIEIISRTIFTHLWPNLKKLSIIGICTMEDDLRNFLRKHSTTLKSLHLGHITTLTKPLVRDPEEPEFVEFVVGLFQWIHQNLTLESATLSGKFTDRWGDGWSVKDRDSQRCIRRDIELWLSHKAPSPVPRPLLQPRDRQPLGKSVAKQWSDDSWSWDFS